MLPRFPGQMRHGGAFQPFRGMQPPGHQPGRYTGWAGFLRWLKTLFVLLAGNQNLTGGFTATQYDNGTKSAGTLTIDPTLGNIQKVTNNGAHTLAPPASPCSGFIDYTNGASAGALTVTGWTKSDGETLTTTNGQGFRGYFAVGVLGSHINWKRMV
jgi:hypothetical protein